jgi:hypothetical protein
MAVIQYWIMIYSIELNNMGLYLWLQGLMTTISKVSVPLLPGLPCPKVWPLHVTSILSHLTFVNFVLITIFFYKRYVHTCQESRGMIIYFTDGCRLEQSIYD